jgi:AcrR family transcriptional regulator
MNAPISAGKGEMIGLRERKKVETRRALERAALRLFAERGFEAVTIDQIAEVAGVSSRTFFRYFSSKDDVIVRPFQDLQGVLRQALAGRPADEPVIAALRAGIGQLAERLERDREELRLRARIMFATTLLVARAQEVRDGWRRLLVDEASRRLDADPATDLRPHVAAACAMAALSAARDVWDRGATDRTLPALVDEAYDLLAAQAMTMRR